LYLLIFSVVYFAGACSSDAHKYMWADEVITGYLARIPLSQVIPAVASGTDIHPPLFHVITRLFTTVMGDNALALHMPAVVGGWLTSIALFVFVTRRSQAIYGADAMLIPFVSLVSKYT